MFLVALGLAGLLFGVGTSEVRRFENAAARDISSRLEGSAKQVKVRTKMDPFKAIGGHLKSATISASIFTTEGLPLFTEPDGSKRGRLDELKIQLHDFELSGLKVKSLDARIPDCRFDFGLAQRKGLIRLTDSGEGVGTVELVEEALRDFVIKKYPAIEQMSIHLKDGLVEFTGKGFFLNFRAGIRMVGKLISKDGNRIEVSEPKLWVEGNEASPGTTALLLGFLNPILDLDKDLKLYGALRIQKIDIRDGSLLAQGRAIVPNRPLGTWLNVGRLILP